MRMALLGSTWSVQIPVSTLTFWSPLPVLMIVRLQFPWVIVMFGDCCAVAAWGEAKKRPAARNAMGGLPVCIGRPHSLGLAGHARIAAPGAQHRGVGVA